MGERETCFLSFFMHFIQEISTKEIQTITDSSHIEQSTRNIDCHGRCTYFLLGSCSNKNFGHIFEDVCFVFFRRCVFCLFSSANFYTAIVQENGWCSVSGRICPSGIFVRSNNFKQVTCNAVCCQCPWIQTVTKNLKSWTG